MADMIEFDHDAEAWLGALVKRWEPLGRMPHTEAESAALGLHHGLVAWFQGDRLDLVYAATHRVTPSEPAFLTLALERWPADLMERDPIWLLPYQLAWARAGVELDAEGLPEDVTINEVGPPRRATPRRNGGGVSRSVSILNGRADGPHTKDNSKPRS